MEPLSTVGRVFDVLGTQIETQVSKYAGFDISTFVWTSKSWLASTETVLITAVVYLLLTYLGVVRKHRPRYGLVITHPYRKRWNLTRSLKLS